jgi:hypothetical protein
MRPYATSAWGLKPGYLLGFDALVVCVLFHEALALFAQRETIQRFGLLLV